MNAQPTLSRKGWKVPSDTDILDREAVLRSKRGYWIGRRTQDILLSLIALAVLWPLMLLVALLIVLDDPKGGPLFVQERVGRDGKLFRIYKFRSMCVDAESILAVLMQESTMNGPVFQMKHDPRITRVGGFIRKTGIDELPQLLNILKGDMSLVGPRPALPREVAQYTAYQRQRLYVQPGLTGYWQIQPHRNDLSFETWIALDLQYIRERSFRVDWKIIFQTVRAVVFMQGE